MCCKIVLEYCVFYTEKKTNPSGCLMHLVESQKLGCEFCNNKPSEVADNITWGGALRLRQWTLQHNIFILEEQSQTESCGVNPTLYTP